jgi:proton glutamate symport protein
MPKFKNSLSFWIIVALLAGLLLGIFWPQMAIHLNLFSKLFLRAIGIIIAPLIFSTLVVGIARHSDLKLVGRLSLKSFVYFEFASTMALLVGLAVGNLAQPGALIHLGPATQAGAAPQIHHGFAEIVLNMLPENVAQMVSDGNVLQIVIFSILFGIALSRVSEEKRRPLVSFFEGLIDTMFKVTKIVMLFAPLGVASAMAYSVAHMGLGVVVQLLKLLLSLYGALAIFVLGVLLPVALIARVPLKKFLGAVAEPVSIAFATTASEPGFPKALENLQKIGVPQEIASFVLPMGYSFNIDGSTLYLALASLFVAQAAGIHLSLLAQVMLCLTLMFSSKGIAGVPRASLVILLATVSSFGLPAEPVFLILGIDELMDMARTAVNQLGNCLAAVVIARWEGKFG